MIASRSVSFVVQLTDDAARDLGGIRTYIERHGSRKRANSLLDRIGKVCNGLSEHPLRGRRIGELLDIGIQDYREIFLDPYRIIYRVVEDNVYVMIIAHGRRDMKTLLERRLLYLLQS